MAKILLIEDDESLRPMLAQFLKERGHEVVEAANGDEGIDAFARSPADLVITDLVMPEKEGIETMEALRGASPTVRIIAMSGLSRRSGFYLQLATKFGADYTLPKPFSLETFGQLVDQALAPRSS